MKGQNIKKKNNSGACYIATICKSGLRGKRERERLSQRFDKRGEETGFSMIILRSCTHRNSIIDTNSISRHLFVTFIDSKPVRLGLDHLSRSIRSYASCHPSCPWSSIVFLDCSQLINGVFVNSRKLYPLHPSLFSPYSLNVASIFFLFNSHPW